MSRRACYTNWHSSLHASRLVKRSEVILPGDVRSNSDVAVKQTTALPNYRETTHYFSEHSGLQALSPERTASQKHAPSLTNQ